MREKPNQFLIKINDLKQVAASAENYSGKRLMLIFSNSESRLKDIPGIDTKYHTQLQEITGDCMKILDTDLKKSFESYNSRLGDLLGNILEDKEALAVLAV